MPDIVFLINPLTVTRHFAHINNFYKPTIKMYKGLGGLYISAGRFRAHYDNYRKGLADFINKAMEIYCDTTLKK